MADLGYCTYGTLARARNLWIDVVVRAPAVVIGEASSVGNASVQTNLDSLTEETPVLKADPADHQPTEEREPCLTIVFSSSQIASPSLMLVKVNWKV